jgi:hypothetical protein
MARLSNPRVGFPTENAPAATMKTTPRHWLGSSAQFKVLGPVKAWPGNNSENSKANSRNQ